jgi:hypothetical protein
MTEEQWLACQYPLPMLTHVRRKATGRRLRLFAAAYARWLGRGLRPREEGGLLLASSLAEQWADSGARPAAADANYVTLKHHPWRAAVVTAGGVHRDDPPDDPGRVCQVALMRDLFGNPFRPLTLDRSALTPSVASLAEATYEHRELPSGHLELARLAVLSDALEEAGCTDAAVLIHLRSPGPHVRGCWAVDLVMGRT